MCLALLQIIQYQVSTDPQPAPPLLQPAGGPYFPPSLEKAMGEGGKLDQGEGKKVGLDKPQLESTAEQSVDDVPVLSNLTVDDLMRQLNIIPTGTLIGNGGPEGVSMEMPSNPPGLGVDPTQMMGVVDIQKQPAGPLPMATEIG